MSNEEHESQAWLAVAAALGISADDEPVRREIRIAADVWLDFGVDDLATSAELRENLSQMAIMARQLADRSERVRKHVQMQLMLTHNQIPIAHQDADNPFADEHLLAIRTIGDLCGGLAETMATPRGPKGDLPRRAAWLRATEVYEDITGKSATFGRNANQQICGQWVEFIRAFCGYVAPGHMPEDGSIEAFHRQRLRVLKSGGNPLVELYFGG